jgi:hypothetical protein
MTENVWAKQITLRITNPECSLLTKIRTFWKVLSGDFTNLTLIRITGVLTEDHVSHFIYSASLQVGGNWRGGDEAYE